MKSFERRSSRKVETCACGMEESCSRHEAWAREEEAIELEIVDDRQELGRRPLLVTSRVEEKYILVDLHKGIFIGTLMEGGIVRLIVGGIVRSMSGMFHLSLGGMVLVSMLGSVFVSVEWMLLESTERTLLL